jgi:transcription antitermination factor NusG
MTEFNEGDKIRAIRNCFGSIEEGKVYTVGRIDSGYLSVDDRPETHPFSEFEKVTEVNVVHNFQIDDVVRVTRSPYDTIKTGEIRGIERISTGSQIFLKDRAGLTMWRSELEPYELQVGDRVQYSRIPGILRTPGWATVVSIGSANYFVGEVDNTEDYDGSNRKWSFSVKDIISVNNEKAEVKAEVKPEPPFKPGDVVKGKNDTGWYKPTEYTIVEYVENAKAAYPKLYHTGPAVIYKKDQGNGYPSWDRVEDVVLVRRPEPVVEPERTDWTVLVERADMLIDAYKITEGAGSYTAQTLTELRDALVEESYRD